MHLILLFASAPQWLDPEKSATPSKLVFTGLVLLVFAIVYVERWMSRKRKGRRSRGYSVGLTAGVMALDEILRPERKHVFEARQKLKEKKQQDDSGGPDDTSKPGQN
jgi:hypothetical protein